MELLEKVDVTHNRAGWGVFEGTSPPGGAVKQVQNVYASAVKGAMKLINNGMSASEGKKDYCLHNIGNVKGFKIASLNINSLLRYEDHLQANVCKCIALRSCFKLKDDNSFTLVSTQTKVHTSILPLTSSLAC